MVLPVWMPEQDFLGVRVAVMQIVAIVGGDEGMRFPWRAARGLCLRAAQLPGPGSLNFKEKVAFAENVAEAIGVLAREIEFFFHHRFGNRAAKAGDSAMRPLLCFESRSRSMRGL